MKNTITGRLVGRKDEKQKLGKALDSAEAEFVAFYGRRRVGKTFLVREFFGAARQSHDVVQGRRD